MRIAVFSDSHKDVDSMIVIVKRERPDMAVHLGDHIADAIDLHSAFPDIPFHYVKGNTDISQGSDGKYIDVRGKRLYLTHGHAYYVKSGLAEIYALSETADMVLFGHTHKPFLTRHNGCWFMNPGSVRNGGTYGVIIINGKIRCEIIES